MGLHVWGDFGDNRAAIHCRSAAIGNGLMVRQAGDTVISCEDIDILSDRKIVPLDATAKPFRKS